MVEFIRKRTRARSEKLNKPHDMRSADRARTEIILPENGIVKVSKSIIVPGELGVIAKVLIPQGHPVFRITGPVVAEPTLYTFQVGNSTHIDPLTENRLPGFGYFTNHSCDPSGRIRILDTNNGLAIEVVAKYDIEHGEEVTFDYATTEYAPIATGVECKCGSEKCRRKITGYKDLPDTVKFIYIAEGIIANYLLQMDGDL